MAQHRRLASSSSLGFALLAAAPASARRRARSPTTRGWRPHPASTSTASSAIVWVVAGALAGLSGILCAYFRPGIKWDMGAQVLLLMFAAVTLGGLGTAFGALRRLDRRRPPRRGLDPLDPVRPQVRGRPGRADRHPAVPPTGHPRPPRENRLGAPWTGFRSSRTRPRRSSARRRSPTRSPRLGLAVHFGYAGLLNMGIAGFMALGAYGYAISILTFGFPWWGGVLVGLRRGGGLRAHPRHPDPAAARRTIWPS